MLIFKTNQKFGLQEAQNSQIYEEDVFIVDLFNENRQRSVIPNQFCIHGVELVCCSCLNFDKFSDSLRNGER